MPSKSYLGRDVKGMTLFKSAVSGTEGAVAASNPYGVQAGLKILKAGGNAVDAAVATALVIGAVEPFHCGIGGGSFSLFYHKKSNKFYALDARGTAPLRAWPEMFLDHEGNVNQELMDHSGRSVAVPVFYKAMDQLLKQFGTMSLKEVSKPAVDLCRNGFRCGFFYERATDSIEVDLYKGKREGFQELYLPEGRPKHYGEMIYNKDLADTMEQVAEKGVDWFYNGPVADEIVAAVNKYQGIYEKGDLSECKVTFREPVRGNYRGYDVISMPPPSSGGAHIIQMLNILENFDLESMGWMSADTIHVMAETMKMMFADRSVSMGDPDFVKICLEHITDKAYGKELAEKISMEKAEEYAPNSQLEAKEYRGCTSNFTVMDKEGNALIQTQTIRDWWGCGIVVPGRGFCLNNTLADFSGKAGVRTSHGLSYGSANGVQAGKTAISSMSPTMIMKDGKPFLALGSAGGPRIMTGILQMIVNVIDFHMNMDEAVNSPFICCLTENQGLELEPGFSPDTKKLLEQKGHNLIEIPEYASMLVLPNGILDLDGIYFPGGTKRADGGGGALTKDGAISIEGLCFCE